MHVHSCEEGAMFSTDSKSEYLIILVHGGGWMGGDSKHVYENAEFLGQTLNCDVYVPNYPKSQMYNEHVQKIFLMGIIFLLLLSRKRSILEVVVLIFISVVASVSTCTYLYHDDVKTHIKHPQHIHDLVRRVKAIQGDKKLILVGHSAGAHLCSLLTTSYSHEVNPIQCVVCISGIYCKSFRQHIYARIVLKAATNFENEEDFFPASNIPDIMPPMLITTSGLEFSGMNRQAIEFVDKLSEMGHDVEHIHYPDHSHFSVRRRWHTDNSEVSKDIVSFIRQKIRK